MKEKWVKLHLSKTTIANYTVIISCLSNINKRFYIALIKTEEDLTELYQHFYNLSIQMTLA